MRNVPFILASASPRRRRLMASFPFSVRVVPSGVPERRKRPGESPARYVKMLAEMKARHVADRAGEGLVLGADTIVFFKGRVLGKPTSALSAKRMLTSLAGKWHAVYTGLSLQARPGRRRWSAAWLTRVKMRDLSPRKIRSLSRLNHNKAGAYAAQQKGNPFVADWRGDYDNVVGLPRKGVRQLLARARRAGYRPL
jgi:MAF protein